MRIYSKILSFFKLIVIVARKYMYWYEFGNRAANGTHIIMYLCKRLLHKYNSDNYISKSLGSKSIPCCTFSLHIAEE